MKVLLFLLTVVLSGCSYSQPVPGAPYLRAVHIGGVLRPGVALVIVEPGSNAPVVITQASGSPLMPSVVSASGIVGAAATLGATLRPDHSENNTSTTTLIRDDPLSPPIPPTPRPVVHPPNGRPPANRPPSNRPPHQHP